MTYCIHAGQLIDLDQPRSYWPDEIVAPGVTAADMAIKEAGHRDLVRIAMHEALAFAGHHDLAARLRDTRSALDKLFAALDVATDEIPESADWFETPAPEPTHIVRIRQRIEEQRSHLRSVMEDAAPIIGAAKMAGGAAYSEGQAVA